MLFYFTGGRANSLGIPQCNPGKSSGLRFRHRRVRRPGQPALYQRGSLHRHLGRSQSRARGGKTIVSFFSFFFCLCFLKQIKCVIVTCLFLCLFMRIYLSFFLCFNEISLSLLLVSMFMTNFVIATFLRFRFTCYFVCRYCIFRGFKLPSVHFSLFMVFKSILLNCFLFVNDEMYVLLLVVLVSFFNYGSKYVCLVLVSFFFQNLPFLSVRPLFILYFAKMSILLFKLYLHILTLSLSTSSSLFCLSASLSIYFIPYVFLSIFCQYRPLKLTLYDINFQNSKWGLWSLLLTNQNVYCRVCILQFIHSRIL